MTAGAPEGIQQRPDAPARAPGSLRFAVVLAVLAGVGALVRLANTLVLRPVDADCTSVDGCFAINGDALYSHLQGELLAQGHGFASSFSYWFLGTIQPGAGDPPLYVVYLGWVSALHGSGGTGARLAGLAGVLGVVGVTWLVTRGRRGARVALGVAAATMAVLVAIAVVPGLGADQLGVHRPAEPIATEIITAPDGTVLNQTAVVDESAILTHRLASGLLGVLGVVLVGLAARRLAGDRAGLVAAGIAAVHPLLWINDAMVLSESLVVAMVALVVLAAYDLWERPSLATAALFGAMVALAGLNRAESLLLGPLIVVPMAWGQRHRLGGLQAGAGRVVVAGLTCVVLLAPWLVHNLVRFEEPTFMTAGTGAVLSAGSCDVAYDGEFVGYYGARCFEQYVDMGWHEWPEPTAEESVRDVPVREGAVRYIRENLAEWPRVATFRVGRMWYLYKPGQTVVLEYQVEGRGRTASWAGLVVFAALVPPSVVGLWTLRRRRMPISPLLAPALAVTATAAATFGVIRYRVPADVTMVMAAAVGIDAVLRRWRPGRARGTIQDSDEPAGATRTP